MRKKTNQALPYGRMYSQGLQGVTSERAYQHLAPLIGSSAATTYYSLRRFHVVPARIALERARAQCQELGTNYQGDLACLAYRVPMFF